MRLTSHPVAEELAERSPRTRGEPLIAFAAVLAVVAALFLDAWSATDERIQVSKFVRTPLFAVFALLVWSGAWGLVGRLLTGERRVSAHLAVASLALLGIFAANRLDYVAFALSAPYADLLALCAIAAVLGWGLWRHLVLVFHHPGRSAALAAATVAVALVSSNTLLEQLGQSDEALAMTYMKYIKAREVRLVDGTNVMQFFRDTREIKGKLEALRRR